MAEAVKAQGKEIVRRIAKDRGDEQAASLNYKCGILGSLGWIPGVDGLSGRTK